MTTKKELIADFNNNLDNAYVFLVIGVVFLLLLFIDGLGMFNIIFSVVGILMTMFSVGFFSECYKLDKELKSL